MKIESIHPANSEVERMLLNAVMCVWNEEDIIESTVKHAFAQGCSNVFIVDNGSTDRTVELAVKAGATLAARFESQYFDEIQKIAHLNTVVKKYNEQSNEEHIWWLYIDADEFPNINTRMTILEFLQSLDPSVRAIQGFMFNHIPTHPPYLDARYHPADFMQLCVKTTTSKIPLLRYDRDKEHLYSAGGAHTFYTGGEFIPVAKDVLNIHHFNFRTPEVSIQRLESLCQVRSDGTRRIDVDDVKAKNRASSAEANSMYIDRLDRAKAEYTKNAYRCLMVDNLPYKYKHIVRWYDHGDISLDNIEDHALILNKAIHHLFMNQYDLALCLFYDVLETINNKELQMLITIKIAQCLSFTNRSEAISLIKPVLKYGVANIREYAFKQIEIISEDRLPVCEEKSTLDFTIQNYFGTFEKKFFVD